MELKSIDEQGRFSGYASIFDVVDNHDDMILRGAFSQTLLENEGDIKLLWQHNFDEPIGVFTEIREDERGLYVEGKLLLDVQRAREAHALMKARAIAGLSIGYIPVKYHIDAQTGVRVLEEVALFEISVVTFPANSAAKISAVKNLTPAEEQSVMRCGDFIHLSDAIDRAMANLTISNP